MVYSSDASPRRPTSGRTGAYSARASGGSSSFASPGRDAGAGGGMGTSTYAGVRASGRANGAVKPKEFKFSFEDAAAAQPPSKSRPLSAGPARAQVRYVTRAKDYTLPRPFLPTQPPFPPPSGGAKNRC